MRKTFKDPEYAFCGNSVKNKEIELVDNKSLERFQHFLFLREEIFSSFNEYECDLLLTKYVKKQMPDRSQLKKNLIRMSLKNK